MSGTDSPLADEQLRVFPNPAGEWFWLELELKTGAPVQIELLELNGRLRRLLFRGVLPAGTNRQHLQAQEPAGSYWLLIRIGDKSWTQKLILH